MTDFPVRRMLAVKQSIYHRILKMRPSPPCDERVRTSLPTLVLEERCRNRRQSRLNVDYRAVLVEHADLHAVLDSIVAHVILSSCMRRWILPSRRPSAKRVRRAGFSRDVDHAHPRPCACIRPQLLRLTMRPLRSPPTSSPTRGCGRLLRARGRPTAIPSAWRAL